MCPEMPPEKTSEKTRKKTEKTPLSKRLNPFYIPTAKPKPAPQEDPEEDEPQEPSSAKYVQNTRPKTYLEVLADRHKNAPELSTIASEMSANFITGLRRHFYQLTLLICTAINLTMLGYSLILFLVAGADESVKALTYALLIFLGAITNIVIIKRFRAALINGEHIEASSFYGVVSRLWRSDVDAEEDAISHEIKVNPDLVLDPAFADIEDDGEDDSIENDASNMLDDPPNDSEDILLDEEE